MGSERHYQAFAGEKYEKLINSKFSIFTFLFGPHYWAYRKMLVQALIFLIIEIIAAGVSFYVCKDYTGIAIFYGVVCVMQLIASFMFGGIYKKFLEKSVDRIIESDATDSEFEEIESCRKRGGTSIVYAFLAAILYSLVIVTLMSAFVSTEKNVIYDPNQQVINKNTVVENKVENVEDDNKVEDDDNNTTNTGNNKEKKNVEERKDDKFKYGVITNILIKNYLNVTIPSVFEKEFNEAYAHEYYLGDVTDKDVSVLISAIDAESAEDVIKDVISKNEVEEEMYTFESNDIKWYIVGYATRKSVVYYNTFDHKSGRVFLFRFEIKKSVYDDDSIYENYEKILKSIVAKEVEEDDEFVKEEDNKPRKIDNQNTNKIETNTNTNTTDDDDENVVENKPSALSTDEDKNETNTSNTTSKKSNSITINSVSNSTTTDDEEDE